MGAKLLEWGGALFLLRLELGQLQVHRIDVDAEEKKASLIHCTLKSDEEAAALLVDARLVAAKEVEDTTVATRYPVLVFQASTASSAAASRKRRRSTDEEEVNAADGEAVPNQSTCRRLIFFLLYETETDGEMGLRFLNELGVPTSTGGNGGDLAIDDSLQVFLADGPYVLLFERGSRMATVLKLQRAKEGGGFCVWREQVDVVGRTRGDTSVPTEVVSCAYVSDVYCTRPHLLIHFQRQPTDREIHTCGVLSKLEQITCCCFISELNEWDFTASPSSAATSFTSWDQDAVSRATITDTSVSTLVVTGTSSNTIYVHTNGILLASYVLPTQPAEMWCMCDESTSKRFVLGIRCNDVNRSFFILGFSSSPENATFELLLSFNHVEFPSAAAVFGSATVQPGKARFQLDLQFGPSFTFLRMRKPLEATLWLHWGASHDAPRSATTSSEWQPSLFAIAVAAVKIYPEELLRGTSTMKPTSRNLSPQHEHEQLLFISAGSSLTSWLGKQSHGLTNSAAAIVRPKFALVNLNVTAHELMLYELSQMVANLPSDVYVMHNPFQRQHLSALQRILHAIRQEILADQQQASAREKRKKVGENGARMKTLKAERRDPASSRRAIQQDTDLQVNELLLMLQKRMNFHTMWFDSAAKDSVED
ncbi:hypothetical protein PF005_g7726 [Phytophthora fragariae]|uniref:Uncharacterized protein n=1 Tax=Phytophthora fragariae TaxID=53985 RepID=A0A6A3YJ95_9STRA|nr:hypothetical protein PF005_g7726 [Phytophthora fragariae]KAE9241732.1 hypothetical protein PF004_g6925 [Phytophthora fragariae]KAE9352855.1 hypothetical protein PF008_g5271 [Phytophthora fragariae]